MRLLGDDVLRSGRRHPRAEDHVRHAVGDHRRSRRPGPDDRAPRIANPRPIARLEERTRHPRRVDRDIRRYRGRGSRRQEVRSRPPECSSHSPLCCSGCRPARWWAVTGSAHPARNRPLPADAVLRGCLQGLGLLKADVARDGWTHEMVGRALTVFRDRRRGRARAARGPDDGRSRCRRRGPGSSRSGRGFCPASVRSSRRRPPLTPSPGSWPTARRRNRAPRMALGEIRESLLVFNAAHYSRNGELDIAALDAALENGETALRRMRFATRWPVRTADALAKSVGRRGAAA